MPIGFNVKKAAQVVAFLVKEQGGSADMIKTVKLVYLSDRRFLELYDQPILNDDLYCLDHGPINSTTLNYIKGSGSNTGLKIWSRYLTSVDDNCNFKTAADELYFSELSDAEEEVMKEVVQKFRKLKPFELVQWIHDNCKEWKNPKGTSINLPYSDIFRALGKSQVDKRNEHVDRTRRQIENVVQ